MKPARILMVLTRPYTNTPTNGREKINTFAHDALTQVATVQTEQLRHVLATGHAKALLGIGLRFVQGLFKTAYPLQALLFSDRHEIKRLLDRVADFQPDAVFVESVRSVFFIHALRQQHPQLRIVCDFDDLMSRRMAEWARHGNAISFGYVARFIPKPLQRILAGPLAGLICRYEATSLAMLEQEALRLCDQIILLSSTEAALLKQQTPVALQHKITLIPPACNPSPMKVPNAPLRFVFIGSDAVLQNRMSIAYLLELWRQYQPSAPLVIYGKMTQSYNGLPDNIRFAGFAASLDAVYTDHSILLSPAFVQGGVKTKMLEAMEFGTLAIGNRISFEGIVDHTHYPIINDEKQLIAFICDPMAHLNTYLDTGREIAKDVAQTHAPERVCLQWQRCLLPD